MPREKSSALGGTRKKKKWAWKKRGIMETYLLGEMFVSLGGINDAGAECASGGRSLASGLGGISLFIGTK